MANTLNGLMPTLYESLAVVSREMLGYVRVANVNASVSQAPLDAEIQVPIAPKITGVDISASMSLPNPTDKTFGNVPIKLTKQKGFRFNLTNEEMKQLQSGGNLSTLRNDTVEQAFRACFNEVEADLGEAVVGGVAVGTAGTAPFSANMKDISNAQKYLDDAGCPQSNRVAVMGTSASLNLNNLTNLTAVDQAGTSETLRSGVVSRLSNIDIFKTAAGVEKGTGAQANYLTVGSKAIGTTVIVVDTGAAAVNVGDVFSIAGDTTQYVLQDGSTKTKFVIADPGLVKASGNNSAVTFKGKYVSNPVFHRNSLILGLRAPARIVGDAADDVVIVTDKESGLMAEVAQYGGYRMSMFEVALTWGFKFIQPEHSVVIMG